MIDPRNPPNFLDNSAFEIQEFLMFSIAVANKEAYRTAQSVDALLTILNHGLADQSQLPFPRISAWCAANCKGMNDKEKVAKLARVIKSTGMGLHSQRARSFLSLRDMLASGQLASLRHCTTSQLEEVPGIGFKTSRFFIMYTRPWEQHLHAILDVHILAWLREQGYEDIPVQTPRSESTYKRIEALFVGEAHHRGVTPLELDRAVWTARKR